MKDKNTPIGLVGFSQAGWIIPIAASKNPKIEFIVLFSCPTITTLEQLRFQFYTNGDNNFWENHTELEAREHIRNDSDRYQFTATDPNKYLNTWASSKIPPTFDISFSSCMLTGYCFGLLY